MKRKIAILGGGIAGLTAAYELTLRPGHRDRYDITVFQMGHRLGGKGASSRNAKAHQRIEEHGLHVFWGFYENAFRMMRETYEELGRPSGAPLAKLEQAFAPHDLIVVPERKGEGWEFWPIEARRNAGVPGSGLDGIDPWEYVPRILQAATEWIAGAFEARPLVRTLRARVDAELPRLRKLLGPAVRSVAATAAIFDALDALLTGALRAVSETSVTTARFVRELAGTILDLELAERLAGEDARRAPEEARRGILFLLEHATRSFLRIVESDDRDHRLRIQIDLALTIVRGMVVDGLLIPPRDWFKLDEVGIEEWLLRHGAREETVRSPLMQGLFASIYSAGLPVGAGTALHGLLRLALTYKGAILYKMQAGMGEAVFAPLYEVLARRGVKFEFFHAVDRLEPASDGSHVARVVLERQATPRNGRYQPLVDVDGLPCWPSEPDHAQLLEGEAIAAGGHDLESWWNAWPAMETRTLEYGRDFDQVVLAIGLGAVGEVCRELLPVEPRLKAMVEHVATTPTQSLQLWLGPELQRMGWRGPSPIVIPCAAPLDTWADMSHLIAREQWPERERPGACIYLTARLDDAEAPPPRGPSDYPERMKEIIRRSAEGWLSQHGGVLWPKAATRDDPRALNWHWLVDPEGREGPARLEAQHLSPMRHPSDRYVLAKPGTNAFRLRADETRFHNLLLAGDWTKNAVSAGCVESAVLSGMMAARALDGGVREGIGDWLSRLPGAATREEQVRSAARSEALRPLAKPVEPPKRRELPRYIVRDGELLAVPPIALDIAVHSFVLRADLEKLTALLDKHLNHGGETVYRPLAPLAILYCSRVDNYPIPDPYGWVPELDFGIWIPALACTRKGGALEPQRLVTFTPYIWVSSDVALTNGRSFYGFTKDLGFMQLPRDDADPAPFTLEAEVVPRFGPKSSSERRPLLSIARAEGSGALRPLGRAGMDLFGVLSEAALQSVRGGTSIADAMELARSMIRGPAGGMRMVFLKQFPDAADPRRACYQAVVEADIQITTPVEGGLVGGAWEACIEQYDTHRIVDTLGLKPVRQRGTTSVCAPITQAFAKFGAVIGPGQIVCEAR